MVIWFLACPKFSELAKCQYFQKCLSCRIDCFHIVRLSCKLKFGPCINFDWVWLGMSRHAQDLKKVTDVFKNKLKRVYCRVHSCHACFYLYLLFWLLNLSARNFKSLIIHKNQFQQNLVVRANHQLVLEKGCYSKLKIYFNANTFSPGLFYWNNVKISVTLGNLNNVMIYLMGHSMSNDQMVPWVTPQILLNFKSYDAFMKEILSRKFQLYSLYGLKIITLWISPKIGHKCLPSEASKIFPTLESNN